MALQSQAIFLPDAYQFCLKNDVIKWQCILVLPLLNEIYQKKSYDR